ncbi:MAG: phage holin family protein [Minisyncoccia bacterium]|jgi:putative membrane protein
MIKLILNWFLYAAAILVTAYILPGVAVSGFVAALILAAVLGAINMLLRPILIFLTLPINVITLGLFTLVINAALVMLAAYMVPDFTVSGFWAAFFFALVLAVIHGLLNALKGGD